MSHEHALTGLKKLIRRALTENDPSEYGRQLRGESDRSALILVGGQLEQIVLYRLQKAMPALNSDERARMFDFEGPVGTFSSRIRLSHALGIVDRADRRRLEIVKELRNAAAHAHCPISFDMGEIRTAVAAIYPPNARAEIMDWPSRKVRDLYIVGAAGIGHGIAQDDGSGPNWDGIVENFRTRWIHKPEPPSQNP